MRDTAEIVIYTSDNVLSFEVKVTMPDFNEQVANALEDGAAMLTLVDGGSLILSGMNYMAIEIKSPPVGE